MVNKGRIRILTRTVKDKVNNELLELLNLYDLDYNAEKIDANAPFLQRMGLKVEEKIVYTSPNLLMVSNLDNYTIFDFLFSQHLQKIKCQTREQVVKQIEEKAKAKQKQGKGQKREN